jgi:hypothetical protein
MVLSIALGVLFAIAFVSSMFSHPTPEAAAGNTSSVVITTDAAAPTTAAPVTTTAAPVTTTAAAAPRAAPPLTPPPPAAPKKTTTSAAPAPVRTTQAPNLCGAPKNPYGYNFCSGSEINSPASDVCSYFDCIDNFWSGKGYMEECKDGTYSMSGGRRGACSDHGGEERAVLS